MSTHRMPSRQRGIALVTSLLLLLIITILALSMFRSVGTQEKIAGNMREKDRALHAAGSAEQYAEWWLLQNNNTANAEVACGAGPPIDGNLNVNAGQICNTATSLPQLGINPAQLPWGFQYIQFLPPGMSVTAGVNGVGGAGDTAYFGIPGFYVADLGVAGDGVSEAYQIDAFGYGATGTTVAVVESVYDIKPGVKNPFTP